MAQLPNPTSQAELELQHALRDCIAAGQRILIAGCPPGTFDQWMYRHEHLLFWPSSEAKNDDDKRIVPAEVGAIIQTRMMSHAMSANLKHQAKARELVCPADALSPGGVRRLLQGVVTWKRKGEMARPTEVRRVPDRPSEPANMNDEGQELLRLIDDAMSALQLVRERVEAFGARWSSVEEQLAALDTFKKVLGGGR